MHYLTGVLLCVRYSAVVRTFVVNETTPSAPNDGLAAFMARTPDIAPISGLGIDQIFTTFNTDFCNAYCNHIHDTHGQKCALCTTPIHVYKYTYENISSIFGSAELKRRYISIPDYVGCGSAYACTGGPCTVIDYHYLSAINDIAISSKLELDGLGICGPLFGIQLQHVHTQERLPSYISETTANAFPSRTDTTRKLWETGKRDQVPVVQTSATNYNPSTYYTDKEAHRTGSTNPNKLQFRQCEGKTVPAVPPVFWPTRIKRNEKIMLGAGPWLTLWEINETSTTLPYSSPSTEQQSLANINYCRNDTNCKANFKSLIPQWDVRSNNFSYVPDNVCDLSQCAWALDYMDKKPAQGDIAIEAFFHSMRKAAENYYETIKKNEIYDEHTLADWPILTSTSKTNYNTYSPGDPGTYTRWTFKQIWKNEHFGHTDNHLPQFKCSNINTIYSALTLYAPRVRKCFEQNQDQNDADTLEHNGKILPEQGLWHCLTKYFGHDPHKIYAAVFTNYNAPYDMYVRQDMPHKHDVKGYMRLTGISENTANSLAFKGMTASAIEDELTQYLNAPENVKVFPQSWSINNGIEWLPKNMHENASFGNKQGVIESASCDCGNIPIRYGSLPIPWDRLNRTFYNEWAKAKPDDEKNPATVLTEMSYGWKTAVGDFQSQLPVGLYVPSNPRFDLHFTVHERDFLRTPEGVASEALLTKYYTGDGSPNKAALTELLFNTTRSLNFMQTKTVFKYGSCMRWPYGIIGRMEMSAALHDEYFPNCTVDKDCRINEESLIGYCETVPVAEGNVKLYTYCANDPLTIEKRLEVCGQPRARYVAVGPTLGIRQPDNVCSSQHKTCLIIPGEASYALNTVLNSDRFPDLVNYDILISPFNWSVASGMMGPDRAKYLVHSKPKLEKFDDDDTTLTGMAALSSFEFNTFLSPGSVDDIQRAMVGIVAKLNASQKADGTFDLPFLDDIPDITTAAVFPPLRIGHVHIMHKDITVQSALPAYPLNLQGDGTDNTCELFLIASTGFKLLGAVIDQGACENVQSDLRKCPLVFGGANVSGAYIEAEISNAPLAAAFVGHYTSRFPFVEEVCAYDVILNITQTNGSHSVAAARTYGTIDIPGGVQTPAIIQPLWNETINITGTNHTINVSQFTQVFGKQIMRAEYPRLIPRQSLHFILFGMLVAVNLFAIIVLLRRAFHPKEPE